MSEYGGTAVALTIYHVTVLLVGFGAIVLGYRLFCRGVYEQGELAVQGRGYRLFQRGAPGMFFALFGTVVVIVGVWRGPEFFRKVIDGAGQTTEEMRMAMGPREAGELAPVLSLLRSLSSGGSAASTGSPSEISQGIAELQSRLHRVEDLLSDMTRQKKDLEEQLAERQAIVRIMEKVLAGNALEEDERKTLKRWYDNHWNLGDAPRPPEKLDGI